METAKFTESAQSFTKSLLGIIALFIVFVYGFASLVVGLGAGLSENVIPLIYFMVFFPILVFIGFLWLVAEHHNKLYGPSDYKNEDNFIKAKIITATSLAVASAKQPENSAGVTEIQLRNIVDVVSNVPRQLKREKWRNHILWVDDRPENNVYERQAFEAQGINFSLALSTYEALELLKTNKFVAIISDMGRKEGLKKAMLFLRSYMRWVIKPLS